MTTRVPPHDNLAERALLGACMLSSDAMSTALGLLAPEDFYRPSHQVIFLAMKKEWDGGRPLDPTNIASSLAKSGDLERAGGAREILALQAETPSTTNSKRYANAIVQMSTYRKAILIASSLVEDAYNTVGDPTDLMEAAMQAMAASGVRLGELPDDLWVLDDFLDRPDSEMSEWCVPGLIRNSWRVVVVAGEGVGKMLRLDEPVPTPSGWSTIGELQIDGEVFDRFGRVCRVTRLSPVDLKPECRTLVFSDGSRIKACVDHRWLTSDRNDRNPNHGYPEGRPHDAREWNYQVRTTRQIEETLTCKGGSEPNHAIPACGAVQYPTASLPIDPYLLGFWLGDGSKKDPRIGCSAEDASEVFARLEASGCKLSDRYGSYEEGFDLRWVYGLTAPLRALGVLNNKHIPETYMQGDASQRTALLQGLMDSDGCVVGDGGCRFYSIDQTLADQVCRLVNGLGCIATVREAKSPKNAYTLKPHLMFVVHFTPDISELIPVSLKRKVNALQPLKTRRTTQRRIVAVEEAESEPMRCITVDSPDSSFLISHQFIPTLNTVLFRQVAIAAAQGIHPLDFNAIKPCRTLIVDLENPEDSVTSVCNPIRERVKNNLTTEYDPDRAWLWHRPSGINLRNRADRIAFESIIARVRPDLVCLGPLYKAYDVSANENDELAAKEVMKVLDVLRSRYNFGLLMEHHAPKESSGSKRKMMPYGSSLWMRWPEIGLGLTPEGEGADTLIVGRWRGDRLENSWPEKLHRSLTWPWQGEYKDNHFKRPQAPPPKLRPPEMTDLDDWEPPPRDRGELDDYDDQFPFPEEPF